MIDTHAHLDFPEFDKDREEVISRFFGQGPAQNSTSIEAGRGKAIVNVGVDLERNRKSIEIAEGHEDVFASVGLHPDYFTKHIACNMKHDWIDKLRETAKHNKVVAIGETGLDYFHITHNTEHGTKKPEEIKKDQREGFLAQIELAKELKLPVIVHCRDVHPVASGGTPEWFGAWEDLYEIISKVRPFPPSLREGRDSPELSFTKFVLHCYSGERKDTEKFLELPNIYFSFSGNITYSKPVEKAEKLMEAVRMIPLERIMLDSDSPFLAPQEFRGKRNEPAYTKYIAYKIAKIKGISDAKVERMTDKNAIDFFGLGKLGQLGKLRKSGIKKKN